MPSSEGPIEPIARDLVYRLFHCLDTRDYDSLASLFCADGVWLRQGRRLVGADQILDALRRRSETMVVHHVVTNLVADAVDDDHATIRSYLTVYRQDPGRPADGPIPIAGAAQVGFCDAEMTRTPAGWRVSLLQVAAPTFLGA